MTSPLELLTNKGERNLSFLNDKFNPIAGAIGGFVMGCWINWAMRKPPFSGIQQHIGYALIGTFLGSYFDKKRNVHLAERDAVLRHYIELHPEDFPTPERKKFSAILEPWVPIR